MRVSIVGTVHGEMGMVTVEALVELLLRLEPDVIFAEVPPSHLKVYMDASHGTLESRAVAQYRATHRVDVVPVDLPKPDYNFFTDAEDMFNAIERTSNFYCRLHDHHMEVIRNGGLSYLNSPQCLQDRADIDQELSATIEWMGHQRFRKVYESWTQANEARDLAMLKEIDTYAARHSEKYGVFLVGAAHLKSLIDQARSEGISSNSVKWDFGRLLNHSPE